MGRRGYACRAKSNRESIPQMYKEHLQTNQKNIGNPIEKCVCGGGGHVKRHFTEKEMANEHMNMCSASLGLRKCH